MSENGLAIKTQLITTNWRCVSSLGVQIMALLSYSLCVSLCVSVSFITMFPPCLFDRETGV